MTDRYDVLAVTIKGGTVTVLETGKTQKNAEASAKMFVLRHVKTDTQIYVAVPAGSYATGDTWHGPEEEETP